MGWKKGDVIMTSQPYAHVLSHKYRHERCSYCLQKQESVKKCTGCSVLRYCGRHCQRQDWSVHKVECRSLQAVAPNTPTDSVLLMLRLVIRHVRGDHTKAMSSDPGLRTFEQLMSHSSDIQQDAGRCEQLRQVCFTLSKMCGPHLTLPDGAQLLDTFGKMVINTFTIADQELQDIGSGIYLSPASLDHRCVANGVVTLCNTTLTVRALDDIPQGELATVSQCVFLSYVDQLAPSWERRQQLQAQYYFLCHCPRCQDPALDEAMSGYTANQTGDQDAEDLTVSTAVKTCQTTADQVDQLKKTAGSEEDIVQRCRDCLSKVTPVLSPSNVYMLRVMDRAFDAAISCALWEDALRWGLQTLPPYRHHLPPYSPNLGLQLLRVAKLQLWLDTAQDALAHLTEAEAIIAVTHGKDSELYAQLQELLAQATHQKAAIEMS